MQTHCRENGWVLWWRIRFLWHLTDIQILDITGTEYYELVDFTSRRDVFGRLSPLSPKRAHWQDIEDTCQICDIHGGS